MGLGYNIFIMKKTHSKYSSAFTLIEASIAVTVIAFVLGGILVGRDMLRTAAIRSQISQFNEMVTTIGVFKLKYKHLPGDLPYDLSVKYNLPGHVPELRTTGNNVIEGYYGIPGYTPTSFSQSGEPVLFWTDLSNSGLMKSPFVTVPDARVGNTFHVPSSTQDFLIRDILPKGVMGERDFFYVWSGGHSMQDRGNHLDSPSSDPEDGQMSDKKNYMTIARVEGIHSGKDVIIADPTFSVMTAYSIDSKLDDGAPQHGKITTMLIDKFTNGGDSAQTSWSYGVIQGPYVDGSGALLTDATDNHMDDNEQTGANCGTNTIPAMYQCSDNVIGVKNGPAYHAVPGDSLTCYDNKNTAGQPMQYSLAQATDNPNCAITLRLDF
jgi:hypothetical protein